MCDYLFFSCGKPEFQLNVSAQVFLLLRSVYVVSLPYLQFSSVTGNTTFP